MGMSPSLTAYSILDSQNKTNAGLMFASLKPMRSARARRAPLFAVLAGRPKKICRGQGGVSSPSTRRRFQAWAPRRLRVLDPEQGERQSPELEKVTKAFIAKAGSVRN